MSYCQSLKICIKSLDIKYTCIKLFKGMYMTSILIFVKNMNKIIWGLPMLSLLLGTHIFFTLRLKYIQKDVFKGIRLSIKPSNTKNAISPFASLSTILAATLGTGNIIGISTAVYFGGAGAIFWCIITGILGMATSYGECFLSLKYRKPYKDTYVGGPMYVLENGLNSKILACIFSICTILASLGVGCTTQVNAIVTSIKDICNIPSYIVGILASLLCGLVIIGGIKSISKICMLIIPAISIFYISCCILVLLINHKYIFPAIFLILKSAFLPSAALGGIMGSSIMAATRYGVARGLFTNEAGLGSAPISAITAHCDNIKEQSLISMSAIFWDTIVMCSITGIAIVSHLLKNPSSTMLKSTLLTHASFSCIPFGNIILDISLIIFAYATLIGWSFFGERAVLYLLGEKFIDKFKIIYILAIFFGSFMSSDIIWEMSDLINAFMMIPNVISLIMLYKEIKI